MHSLFALPQCLVVAMALLAVVPAQNCVFNSGNDPGSSGGGLAILLPTSPGQFRRTHILVPAMFFQNVPTRIIDIAYYLGGGWRQVHYEEVTIKMGQTGVAALSGNFATNITTPLQTVLSVRDHLFVEGVGQGFVPIGLQSSYQFLPGGGSLLIEVVLKGGNVLAEQAWSYPWSVPYGSTMIGEGATVPTSGSVYTTAPKLRLCTDRAESILFGQTCQGSGTSTPLLGVSGRPTLGASSTIWLSDAPANAPAACAFGFDNAPPFPLQLTSLGAPGCRQYFAVAFADFVLADNLGVGQRTVVIPNAPTTIGAIVYAQYFVLDPPANALDITASNYARLQAGY